MPRRALGFATTVCDSNAFGFCQDCYIGKELLGSASAEIASTGCEQFFLWLQPELPRRVITVSLPLASARFATASCKYLC